MISARPPPTLSSSMEVVPKRFRTGSISSRLRSASELFEDGVIETRQQKGVLKDLIIAGDEKLSDALARYERGDKEPIKSLLREGVLNRKSSLDLLGDVGDLSFDFLSVSATSNTFGATAMKTIDTPFPMDEEDLTFEVLLQDSDVFGKSPPKKFFPPSNIGQRKPSFSSTVGRAQMGARSASLSSVSSFTRTKPLSIPPITLSPHLSSLNLNTSIGTPPPDLLEMHILDETGLGAWAHPALRGGSFARARDLLDFDSDDLESIPESPREDNDDESGASRSEQHSPIVERSPPPIVVSTPSVSQPKPRRTVTPKQSVSGSTSATSAPISIPRPKSGGRQSSSNKRSASQAAANSPTSSTVPTEDKAALRRAQGVPMVGAYSPESRRLRVERFVMKRDRRVWKKKVKYDVRKNFADSRLRVKGRFVKKEDEEMLRDLMTMV